MHLADEHIALLNHAVECMERIGCKCKVQAGSRRGCDGYFVSVSEAGTTHEWFFSSPAEVAEWAEGAEKIYDQYLDVKEALARVR